MRLPSFPYLVSSGHQQSQYLGELASEIVVKKSVDPEKGFEVLSAPNLGGPCPKDPF